MGNRLGCHYRNKTGSAVALPFSTNGWCRKGSGALCVDLPGKTGNFAGSGFFVEDSFFCCLIDRGFGRVEPLTGVFRFLGHGETYILDHVLHPGLNGFVAQATPLVLTRAFQC
jgi:hypothetical protein